MEHLSSSCLLVVAGSLSLFLSINEKRDNAVSEEKQEERRRRRRRKIKKEKRERRKRSHEEEGQRKRENVGVE